VECLKYSPFSVTILSFWIVIVENFTELREYLGDDYLEFVKAFGVDLGNTVNNNDGVYAIGHFGSLLQYVTEQL